MTIRVGTRASSLAVAQTQGVADRLARASGTPVELVLIESDGDRLAGSLASLGGTGVFASALRDALLDGRCDAIVHSLKDLPTAPIAGLTIGGVPLREDPRDALCARDGLTLAELPQGARVGTGSPRRRAALLALRPDLDVIDIRGNIDTRLRRVANGPGSGDLDAIVLAASGLTRLGRLDAATEIFDFDRMPQAPGQGALAIEVRASSDGTLDVSPELRAALDAITDAGTLLAVTAERELLAALEAGCAAPIGAAGIAGSGAVSSGAESFSTVGLSTVSLSTVSLTATVYGADGAGSLTETASASHAEPLEAARRVGRELAASLLASGAAELAPLGAAS